VKEAGFLKRGLKNAPECLRNAGCFLTAGIPPQSQDKAQMNWDPQPDNLFKNKSGCIRLNLIGLLPNTISIHTVLQSKSVTSRCFKIVLSY